MISQISTRLFRALVQAKKAQAYLTIVDGFRKKGRMGEADRFAEFCETFAQIDADARADHGSKLWGEYRTSLAFYIKAVESLNA